MSDTKLDAADAAAHSIAIVRRNRELVAKGSFVIPLDRLDQLLQLAERGLEAERAQANPDRPARKLAAFDRIDKLLRSDDGTFTAYNADGEACALIERHDGEVYRCKRHDLLEAIEGLTEAEGWEP